MNNLNETIFSVCLAIVLHLVNWSKELTLFVPPGNLPKPTAGLILSCQLTGIDLCFRKRARVVDSIDAKPHGGSNFYNWFD